jgi:hypothetical protein
MGVFCEACIPVAVSAVRNRETVFAVRAIYESGDWGVPLRFSRNHRVNHQDIARFFS